MEQGIVMSIEEEKKKRTRRKKGEKKRVVINEDQSKFVMNLNENDKERSELIKILKEANNKDFGSEVGFKELVLYSLSKITAKDIEKIKDQSMTEMERVEKSLNDYNEKNNTSLSLGEYLVEKLKIQ